MAGPLKHLRSAPLVESYGGGGFRLGGGFVAGSVLILPDRVEPWTLVDWRELAPSHLEPLLALAKDLDFVLIGCGADIAAPPKFLKRVFEDAGLGYDVMQTGAACRTYNVVLAEGRRMAAAMIAVD